MCQLEIDFSVIPEHHENNIESQWHFEVAQKLVEVNMEALSQLIKKEVI